jgi:hypothetical protein
LERGASIAPSPAAELVIVPLGCGAVAVVEVEVGTAGAVEKEVGVVVVTGGRRLAAMGGTVAAAAIGWGPVVARVGWMADATVGAEGTMVVWRHWRVVGGRGNGSGWRGVGFHLCISYIYTVYSFSLEVSLV